MACVEPLKPRQAPRSRWRGRLVMSSAGGPYDRRGGGGGDSTVPSSRASSEWQASELGSDTVFSEQDDIIEEEQEEDLLMDDEARQAADLGGALWAAADEGRVGDMSQLLAAGADANWPSPRESHQTPLVAAVYAGRHARQAVRMLLDAGADVECVDDDGSTVLMHACSGTAVDIVQMILEADADAEVACFYSGRTALMGCAARGCEETLLCLLRARPDLNLDAIDKSGKTAAHHCTTAACALVLLAAGANFNLRDKDDQTPWDILASLQKQSSKHTNSSAPSETPSTSSAMNKPLSPVLPPPSLISSNPALMSSLSSMPTSRLSSLSSSPAPTAIATSTTAKTTDAAPLPSFLDSSNCGPLEAAVIMRQPTMLHRHLAAGMAPANADRAGLAGLLQLAECSQNRPVARPVCAETVRLVRDAMRWVAV